MTFSACFDNSYSTSCSHELPLDRLIQRSSRTYPARIQCGPDVLVCTVYGRLLSTATLCNSTCVFDVILTVHRRYYVEIKCQLDAADVFIADLIACSTCFGHHYSHQLRVMCPVCRMLQHPANRIHNPQLHNRPAT